MSLTSSLLTLRSRPHGDAQRLAERGENLGVKEIRELGEAFQAEGTIKMPYGALVMRDIQRMDTRSRGLLA